MCRTCSNAGRGLILWASEGDAPGDVRHFGWLRPKPFPAPAKASRHLWPSPAPQPCLAEPVHCGRGLSAACPRPPVRGLLLLFLWASEGDAPGDVRHYGWLCSKPFPAPAKASRHLWPSPAPQPCLAEPVHCGRPRPLCGLSEACLFSSYGPPKATCQATFQATCQSHLTEQLQLLSRPIPQYFWS